MPDEYVVHVYESKDKNAISRCMQSACNEFEYVDAKYSVTMYPSGGGVLHTAMFIGKRKKES